MTRTAIGTERFPALDSIRAFAAIAVVAFHAYKDLAGRPGWDSPLGTFAYSLQWAVPVFFVLSGFLLYRPFALAIARRAALPDARRFLLRRAVRILPAYWLALVVFGTIARPNELWSPDGLVRYGLLLQVFDADTVYHVLGTAWSLSIEVAFYVALPFLAFVAARLLGRRPRLLPHVAVVVAMALLAEAARRFVVSPLEASAGEDPTLAGFTLVGSFAPFAAGMVLAVLSVSRLDAVALLRRLPRVVRLRALRLLRADGPWLALALLAYSLGLLLEARNITPWDSATWAMVGAVALLAPLVLRPQTSRIARLLGGARPLVALGAVSYGLYLWHWPIQEVIRTHGFAVPGTVPGWIAGFLTTGTLGTLAAVASYRLLELPLNRWVRARTAPATAGAAPDATGGLESGPASGPVSADVPEPPVAATPRPPRPALPSAPAPSAR